MQVQTSEQTFLNFLNVGKSRFPPKKFYNINYKVASVYFPPFLKGLFRICQIFNLLWEIVYAIDWYSHSVTLSPLRSESWITSGQELGRLGLSWTKPFCLWKPHRKLLFQVFPGNSRHWRRTRRCGFTFDRTGSFRSCSTVSSGSRGSSTSSDCLESCCTAWQICRWIPTYLLTQLYFIKCCRQTRGAV